MKQVFLRCLSVLLCCFAIMTVLPTASAAEDYRGWSQSDSRWGSMVMGDDPEATVSYCGCTSVSMAKLFRQAGVVDSSYTPKNFVNAMNKAGGYVMAPSDQSGGIKNWNTAAQLGGMSYLGKITTSDPAKVINYVKSGYHIIVTGPTKYGNHSCPVDNAMTLSNGYLTIMNSWKTPANNINVKYSKVFSSISSIKLFRAPQTFSYAAIPADTYYMKNVSADQYLSVDSDGANVCVADYTGKKTMQIQVKKSGSSYTMNPASSTKLINPAGDYVAHNLNVNLYKNASDDTQKWYFQWTENGYLIRNKYQPNCVLATDGTNVEIQYYTGSTRQLWKLEPVTPRSVEITGEITDGVLDYTIHPNFRTGVHELWVGYYEDGKFLMAEHHAVDLEEVESSGLVVGSLPLSAACSEVRCFLLDSNMVPLGASCQLQP